MVVMVMDLALYKYSFVHSCFIHFAIECVDRGWQILSIDFVPLSFDVALNMSRANPRNI